MRSRKMRRTSLKRGEEEVFGGIGGLSAEEENLNFRVFLEVYTHTHTHTCVYGEVDYKDAYAYVYVCLYIHTHTHLFMCVYMYTRIYMYTHAHIYTQVCLYMCIYVCLLADTSALAGNGEANTRHPWQSSILGGAAASASAERLARCQRLFITLSL
jgi:hypothetical protein